MGHGVGVGNRPDNTAVVIGRDGELCGWQVKNQIPPEEEPHYVPDGQRRLFETDVLFGIAICHEGWRYPETARAATAAAGLPPAANRQRHDRPDARALGRSRLALLREGDDRPGGRERHLLRQRQLRLRYQESATSLIAPDGICLAHVPYGREQLLVQDLDLAQATGFYAKRYDPALYPSRGQGSADSGQIRAGVG